MPEVSLCHILWCGRAALPAAATLVWGGHAVVTNVLPAEAEAYVTGKASETAWARDHPFTTTSQQLHGGCCPLSGEYPQNSGKQLPSMRKQQLLWWCWEETAGQLVKSTALVWVKLPRGQLRASVQKETLRTMRVWRQNPMQRQSWWLLKHNNEQSN